MNDPNAFDDLARRKLAERDFTFDPAHWSAMEELLAERGRRPKPWWPWMTAGIVLLGGAALWSVTGDEPHAPDQKPGVIAEKTTGQAPGRIIDVHASEEQGGRSIKAAEQAPPSSAQEAIGTPSSGTAMASTSLPTTGIAQRPATAMDPAGKKAKAFMGSSGDPALMTGAVHVREHAFAENPPEDRPGSQDPLEDQHIADPFAGTPPARTTTNGPEDHPAETAPGADDSDPAAGPTGSLEQVPPAGHLTTSTTEPDLAGPDPDPATAVSATVASDSGELPIPTNDSSAPPAVGPVAVPPAPPAWLAVRAPFEFSLLGGAFSTTGVYSGEGTGTWLATTARQNTMGFGIEAVRNIGRHFGVGTGLHASTYKERLTNEELVRLDEVLSNSYYWVQHDTMVLTVIGDTTIGATTYQITELVPMTINELAIDTDTAYQTTVLRQRRTVVNTVSYVEIPLLVDAHTTCGRWVFGVRGGPTFGLLTGRKGTIPGDGENGYTELNDRTFRSMTLGATARVYARYRLSGNWAIGVEPTWRQQLGNAFGEADVQRRGIGLGGYLSISYRIASKSGTP